MANIFNNTSSISPRRSQFNLSYEKKFDCDMGKLIPVMCDEVVPGDILKLGNEVVIRFQPLVAPVLHEINCYVHYFFVPTRLVMPDWEEFISGGVTGETSVALPRWSPTSNAMYSLWDYFGFPTGVVPTGALPLSFPKRAYNLIWNEYYRDQNLQTEKDLDDEAVLRRAWEKDYFTSALPWQQRGTAPALPISGLTNAYWDISDISNNGGGVVTGSDIIGVSSANNTFLAYNGSKASSLVAGLNKNTVDFSDAATFDVSDLRLAFQIQKWLERNARSGVRYTEFLKAHFGVSPRDERLQRPEYIGGSKSPIIISEVLQTSSTDATSPQGNLAGHGLTASSNFVGSYRAKEFGYVLGIMSIMPRATYQQGIDKQWLRRTKYDFYFPEFANLSEQAVETAEVFASASESENTSIFGYQGRYNELRYKKSMVCGGMRSTLDYWHLGRQFEFSPLLNESFIECNPSKRIFAVQDEPGMIVNIANIIDAIRPIPITSEPGLVDHN